MSDFAAIKRQAEAAREFDVPLKGMSFTLRLPTQHEVDVEVARARLHEGIDDPALLVRVTRALVEKAVVRWSGVTAGKLFDGGGDEAVDLVPGAAALLFDADQEAWTGLLGAFVNERSARDQKQGSAAKN